MAPSVQCPNCGTAVPGGSRFCQKCGTAVSGGKAPAAAPKKKPPTTGNSQLKIFVAGALIIALLGSLAMYGIQRAKAAKEHAAAQTPALNVASNSIEGAGPVPDWLGKANKYIQADYIWAASHHNELQYFPCFCGCYNSAGHVSNSECYYKRDKGGKITAYDSHAYG